MTKNLKHTTTLLATQVMLLGTLPVTVQAATFNLLEATVADINAVFDAGALTSEQLTQLYLNRIDAYDDSGPNINSIITVNPNALETAAALDLERQTTGARSSLHGIPIIVKDNYDTFDLPTTAGALALQDSIPPDDAFMVEQLRMAGAVVLGKSNLAEFAFSGANSFSSLGGQTLNPYALDRVPAGSSGGTGAAIAANFGTVGLGTDTGSSIRGPASVNSLVGLRPTIGLTSRDGIVPLNLSRDVGGPITRTVADTATIMDVVSGYDPADSVTESSIGRIPVSYTNLLNADGLQGTRIGVLRELIESDTRTTTPAFVRGETDPQVLALTNAAIEDMRILGAEIVDPVEIPDLYSLSAASSGGERFKYDLNNYLASLGPDAPVQSLAEIIESGQFDPAIEQTLRSAEAVEIAPQDDPRYLQAEANRENFRNAVLQVMDDNSLDALLYPTFKTPPRVIGDTESTYGANSSVISPPTGFPAISVPMGFTSEGLPLGIQLLGRPFDEPNLIELAYAYEQGTLHRLPPGSTPPLPGEVFEYEPVPEASSTAALGVFGLAVLGLKLKRRRCVDNLFHS